MDTIVQLISSVGFPIAACVYLFYMFNKQQEAHKAEMDKLAEAVNNNTHAITKLYERLSYESNK